MTPKTFYQYRHIIAGTLTTILSLIILLSTVNLARAESGLDWLAAQHQGDGSYALVDDVATAQQSKLETLRTFKLLDQSISIYQNLAL